MYSFFFSENSVDSKSYLCAFPVYTKKVKLRKAAYKFRYNEDLNAFEYIWMNPGQLRKDVIKANDLQIQI